MPGRGLFLTLINLSVCFLLVAFLFLSFRDFSPFFDWILSLKSVLEVSCSSELISDSPEIGARADWLLAERSRSKEEELAEERGVE